MQDTSSEIRQQQIAFFKTKTPLERLNMAIEQCESVKKIVENAIRAENAQISLAELKVRVFERYYKNDFSTEQIQQISESIRKYYTKSVIS